MREDALDEGRVVRLRLPPRGRFFGAPRERRPARWRERIVAQQRGDDLEARKLRLCQARLLLELRGMITG